MRNLSLSMGSPCTHEMILWVHVLYHHTMLFGFILYYLTLYRKLILQVHLAWTILIIQTLPGPYLLFRLSLNHTRSQVHSTILILYKAHTLLYHTTSSGLPSTHREYNIFYSLCLYHTHSLGSPCTILILKAHAVNTHSLG